MNNTNLATLRNRNTPTQEFRRAADILASLIATDTAAQLHSTTVAIVAILRAGLVFLPPFLKLFPSAPVGFFGIRRNEETALPILYYENLPSLSPDHSILLLDPMLATGGSASLALDHLKNTGPIHLITLLASQPGVAFVKKRHPNVSISSVAIDPGLDAKKFIVPGLGDFGNRYFGT